MYHVQHMTLNTFYHGHPSGLNQTIKDYFFKTLQYFYVFLTIILKYDNPTNLQLGISLRLCFRLAPGFILRGISKTNTVSFHVIWPGLLVR